MNENVTGQNGGERIRWNCPEKLIQTTRKGQKCNWGQ